MELFIQVRDGEAYEHPILGTNFRQAFPHIDCENLPPEFARFERVAPKVGVYEVYVGCSYKKDDRGWFVDVHEYRAMTPEEKQAKIDAAKADQPYPSWTFSEETCQWVPPVPIPQDGQNYLWDEQGQQWVQTQALCAWDASKLGMI